MYLILFISIEKEKNKMEITVDTNFLVSATQWDYSVAHKLLTKLIEKNACIFTTKDVLQEFSEVLERDFQYSSEEIAKIVEKVVAFVILFETKSKIYVVKDDPDDNKILECAVDSNSEYIITYDQHLLKLKEFQGIKIVKPEEFLEIF